MALLNLQVDAQPNEGFSIISEQGNAVQAIAVAGSAGGVTSVSVAGQLTNQGTASDPIITTLGGLVTGLANVAARNAIPLNQRNVGTTAYEVDTDQTWRLIGGTADGNWTDVTVYTVSNVHAGIVPAVGVANTVLQSNGAAAVWNTALQLGAAPAQSGDMRVSNAFTLKYRNSNGLSDLSVIDLAVNGVQSITIGDNNTGNGLILNCGAGGLRFQVSGATQVSIGTNVVNVFAANQLFAGTVNSPLINQTNNAGPTPFTLRAAGATAASNGNGGRLLLQGGIKDGTGLHRGPVLQLNVDDTLANMQNLLECGEVIQGNRVLALLRTAMLTTTEMPANTGDLVAYLGNAATLPTANPVGGGILYVNAGALTYRGPAGTITPLAAA